MKKKIVAFMLICVAVFIYGCGKEAPDQPMSSQEITTEAVTESEAQTETEKELTTDEKMDAFINEINGLLDDEMVFVEEFTPHDSDNDHYRVEFRLHVFTDALGRCYQYNDATVDFIFKDNSSDNLSIRIYMEHATEEQCYKIIENVSPYLSDRLTKEELDESIQELKRVERTTGFYINDISLTLLGHDDDWELMIRSDRL